MCLTKAACKVTFWLVLNTKRGYTWTNNWSQFYAFENVFSWEPALWLVYYNICTILGHHSWVPLNSIYSFYLKKHPKACKVTFWLDLSTIMGTLDKLWSRFCALKTFFPSGIMDCILCFEMFFAGNQLYDWSTIIYVLYLGTILGYPWIASIVFIWKNIPKHVKWHSG